MSELVDFTDDVINSEAPLTVAYFTAPWCGPCRMLKPRLEELESENLGMTVVRIDASIETDRAADFKIMTVPTLLLYANHHGDLAPEQRRFAQTARETWRSPR